MLAEEIALNVAGQTVREGLNKLTGNKRDIVLNAILAAFGLMLCIASVKKLVQAAGGHDAEAAHR